jgi:hypothetical protein
MRARPGEKAASLAAVAGLLAVVVVAGCCPAVRHVYPGPERPASETSALSAGSAGVGIVAVDGVSTLCFPDRTVGEIVVLPGERTIEVRWRGAAATTVVGRYSTASALLTFEADAGRRYAVGCRQASFWISDRETGKVIAVAGGGGTAD